MLALALVVGGRDDPHRSVQVEIAPPHGGHFGATLSCQCEKAHIRAERVAEEFRRFPDSRQFPHGQDPIALALDVRLADALGRREIDPVAAHGEAEDRLDEGQHVVG